MKSIEKYAYLTGIGPDKVSFIAYQSSRGALSEKYAYLTGIGPDKVSFIAYQSSRGALSDFIHSYLEDYPNNLWGQLKRELTSRFAEITVSQHVSMLLRKVKQAPNEMCSCLQSDC